tara:strand:+ start:835 stop:1014 length:180 start_codon:yes stop_codon:yes gene_type:complete
MKSNIENRTSAIDLTPHNKINVDVLKKRIYQKKKKEIIQSRIIIASAIVSLGVISYFAG